MQLLHIHSLQKGIMLTFSGWEKPKLLQGKEKAHNCVHSQCGKEFLQSEKLIAG